MNTPTNTGKLVGTLFLTAMFASLFGGGLVESILSAPDVLSALRENQTLVTTGALFELVNAIAVIGIGVFMFPVLKQHSENLARGYFAIRVLEAVFCSLIVISPLSLITLSQELGTVDAAYLQAASALSLAERARVMGLLIPLFFSLGALLLYTALYQAKLLPRFISIWGFVAAVFILINNLLLTFQVEVGLAVSLVLVLPIITNEVFLGIWLIVKGFNPIFIQSK
jgi:hypothetical protein